jgi:hypothetical protein
VEGSAVVGFYAAAPAWVGVEPSEDLWSCAPIDGAGPEGRCFWGRKRPRPQGRGFYRRPASQDRFAAGAEAGSGAEEQPAKADAGQWGWRWSEGGASPSKFGPACAKFPGCGS